MPTSYNYAWVPRCGRLPISSVLVAADEMWNWSERLDFFTRSFITYSAMGERQMLPWQIKSIFIIFLYLHLSLVFLLKCPILQVFSAFSCFCVSGVSSQIFPYFLVLFSAILVNLLVNKCSVPTGCFRLLLLEAALPVRHRTAHGCKHSALR